ncbi:MAG: beta-lactamase family protein [Candidatus Eisenbacteria bacterium]|uniref:Beta-lactamase family protein n=1 Tax=Eiseniibacteriota bacterium TaxID=2212470 RepID=A0A956M0V0_UNCEI|nr:beta-lactamase family protein [Candidatus Eisenbacteria bacterium]
MRTTIPVPGCRHEDPSCRPRHVRSRIGIAARYAISVAFVMMSLVSIKGPMSVGPAGASNGTTAHSSADDATGGRMNEREDAAALVGLWSARRDFGPARRGVLRVCVQDGQARATIADAEVTFAWPAAAPDEATRSGESIDAGSTELRFDLPDEQGGFRGRLLANGRIEGHWIQPATVASTVRYATPVTLEPVAPRTLDPGAGADRAWRPAASDTEASSAIPTDANGCWEGVVRPLDDRITFYLSLVRDADGVVRGFFRNPEANFGRWFSFDRVERTGSQVRFLAGVEEVLTGELDADSRALTIDIPDLGGEYRLQRVDGHESDFYPRPGPQGPYVYRPPAATDDGWPVASLADVDMDVATMEQLVQLILDEPMVAIDSPEIHALLVARHGKLVLEEYFHGSNRDEIHDTRSASKSITSVLVGAAIQDGAPLALSTAVVPFLRESMAPDRVAMDRVAPDQPVTDRVAPDRTDANDTDDARKSKITLQDLLTMSSGLACDDGDSDSPGNEDAMQNQTEQPDWARYTLDLPMVHAPGEHAAYCSGGANLAGAVASAATGRWLPDLYREELAERLGLGRYAMNLTPAGEGYGGGGLRLTGRDFLRIGQLLLQDGRWDDRTILDASFVSESISPLVRLRDQGYGYLWWTIDYPDRGGTVRGFYAGGNGGQYLIGIPELDLLVVSFGGNYNQAVLHRPKLEYVPSYIVRAIELGASGDDSDR